MELRARTVDCDHTRDHEPANVEASLAAALDRASAAGQWAIVAALAAELQARRLAASNGAVVPLDVARRERGGLR